MDYGNEAPTEFYWAVLPIKFLYQHLDLKTYPNSKKLPMFIYDFEDKTTIFNLKKSEGFFLLTELYKGKTIQKQNFNEKYIVNCRGYKEDDIHLTTDGRYYKYGKEPTIIDIGYNFITRNNLSKQLKARE